MSFIVLGMPRSRTFWLSRFLSYGTWHCGHEEIIHLRSLADIASWFAQPMTGTSETAAAQFWRLIPTGVRTVVIRRPASEVGESMARLGYHIDPQLLHKLDRKLEQIERRVPDVLSVWFAELANEQTCQRIFEHCLPYPHDHNWWQAMARINLQVNVHQIMRYHTAHKPQLDKLAQIAKHTIIAQMQPRPERAGLSFQEEHLDALFTPDGLYLQEQHAVYMGESTSAWTERNNALLYALAAQNGLHLLTARNNGRLCGYILSVVSQTPERLGTVASQIRFFGVGVPGIGMRLQRAAIASLQAKGVTELHFSAEPGSRVPPLYRRLGAQPNGSMFKLILSKY